MRYRESREQSAELLRMVLPMMSRHSAAFHPLSYAVWYEYVSGVNLGLKGAVDERIAGGNLLSDADMQRLFDEYVAKRDIESSMRMRVQIQKVIEQVSEATSQANTEVTEYSRGLSEYQQRLKQEINPDALAGLVDSILGDTTRVREKTGDIRQNLEGSNQEVERLREELEMAQGLALMDPLTGLLNRRGFETHVRKLESDGLERCGMLTIDIDHFKAINDTHGHLLGDRVIAAVAQIIKTSVGDKGEVARLGGEEFSALLAGSSPSAAAELAERIRAAIEKGRIRRQDRDESIGGVTVSIGIAISMPGEEFEVLMERADRALYKSKQDGRNRVTISTRSDN
jgi:diguanylate cyclase